MKKLIIGGLILFLCSCGNAVSWERREHADPSPYDQKIVDWQCREKGYEGWDWRSGGCK